MLSTVSTALCAKSMISEFPRLGELASFHREISTSRFYGFPHSQHLEIEEVRRKFQALEEDLSCLDQESWQFLLNEARDLTLLKSDPRGWNQLFEKLNETKGYRYLQELGCSDIRFIPRSTATGIETPDLLGKLDARHIICEVKTLNRSDNYYDRVRTPRVTEPPIALEDGMARKVESILSKALSQLLAFGSANDLRVVFLIVNYDYPFEYVENYNLGVREIFRALRGERIEISVGT